MQHRWYLQLAVLCIMCAFRLTRPLVLAGVRCRLLPSTSSSLSRMRMRMSSSSSTTTTTTGFPSLLSSAADKRTNFLFVGGKGGVGKTSTSSAIAIALSDQGLRTLLVSTDPAHSLGDALDTNLSSGQITPIVTEQNLWALELSVDEAMANFKQTLSGLDSATLSSKLGVPKDLIDSLGLDDLASIFTNPPPGIDEIVALLEIFAFANTKDAITGRPRYDRIVIDTAPTGHTLRLLQLPDFLNSLVGKLIIFRGKLQGALETFKGLFGGGGGGGSGGGGSLTEALDKLEELQSKMASMKATLQNKDATQFVVVTIATSLAVAESKRLVQSLTQEGIALRGIVCNQVVLDSSSSAYITTRRAGQQACIASLKRAAPESIEFTEVPYVDTEITGIYGLKYFAQLAHAPKAKTATNPIDSRKLTIFGGKGGVGKTTTSASWGMRLSDSGIKTLVVSTDPAHSLGDAFREQLSGTPRLLESTLDGSGGELWAMEIDPQAAMAEFRDTMQEALGSGTESGVGGSAEGRNWDPRSSRSSSGAGGAGSFMSGLGLPDLKAELSSMLSGSGEKGDASLLSVPGSDEVVALTKIVTYLDEGFTRQDGSVIRFDRIVVDTAPTGHTLRMLQLPEFLQELVGKMKTVRDKANGMLGSGSSGAAEDNRLEKFEQRMKRLELLLHNPKECEFVVVTIPTELAAAESQRLLQALDEESIAVRRVVINQVIPEPGQGGDAEAATASANAYLDRLRQGQRNSIRDLQQTADTSSVPLVQVPYFDTEVRTVYGLRLIGRHLFPPSSTA